MMNWLTYFMRMAEFISAKSKDPNTKVGAVAAAPDNRVLETGFNGIPRGVHDLDWRMSRDDGMKYIWTGHAEENLVAHAARARLEGATVYVTHMCCATCARMLINSGVAKVVVGPGTTNMPTIQFYAAQDMFREAGVILERSVPEV